MSGGVQNIVCPPGLKVWGAPLPPTKLRQMMDLKHPRYGIPFLQRKFYTNRFVFDRNKIFLNFCKIAQNDSDIFCFTVTYYLFKHSLYFNFFSWPSGRSGEYSSGPCQSVVEWRLVMHVNGRNNHATSCFKRFNSRLDRPTKENSHTAYVRRWG